MTVTEPLLVGVKQAAVIAGTGRDAMYELVRTGRIRSLVVKGRRRVPRSELEAWIERELERSDAMATDRSEQNGPDRSDRPSP